MSALQPVSSPPLGALPSVGARLVAVLSSFKLAFWLLVILGVLTLAGTLEQAHTSLYDVQVKFFESIALVWWVGGVFPVPLPGGYLVLSVLFANLLVGGVVRLRKRKTTAGILVTHLGILALLAGGFVEHQFSTKGQMTLREGESGSEYASSFEWELVLAEALPGGGEREYVIPQERFLDLDGEDTARLQAAELPFDVVLSYYARNARPRAAAPGEPYAIEGVALQSVAPETSGDRINLPGLLATLRPKQGGARAERAHLWGGQRAPWVVRQGERVFALDLRRRTWTVPFTLRLDRFEHERYPGMSMAKRFSSFVTKTERGAAPERIHITMNEPLRHRGYTFYQSGWGPEDAGPGEPLFSTFSVVANPSDRVPQYATYVIALGLLIHFGWRLLRFIDAEARRRRARKEAA